jgi:hypothetical protein
MPWRHQGGGGIPQTVLTSALVGGEWSASRPSRFTLGKRALGTHRIGGWVDPGVGMNAVEKRKILHCRESNPGHPARRYPDSLLLGRYETKFNSPESLHVNAYTKFNRNPFEY